MMTLAPDDNMCTGLHLHRLPGPVIFPATQHVFYVHIVLLETEKPGTVDALIVSELREKLRRNSVLQCHGRSPPCGADYLF
jgi:hypothetical protein